MLKRIPWTALALSLAVVLSSGFAVQPVWDAATHTDLTEAYLVRPLSYVLLAPLSDVLDMLTLFSARQHVAMLVSVLLLFVAWRVVRGVRGSATVRGHVVATGAFLLGVIVVACAIAVLPRPMATLVSDNASIVRIDMHSHTSASHDGRPGWNAERNRAWHRDGGYDVAYVTDHGAVGGAEQGVARNPVPAGEGVTLLQGIEVTWTGEHVAILGAQRAYKGLLTENLRDVDEQGLRLASLVPAREPVVIWNHPHQLARLPAAKGTSTAGVRAIEVSNGAPDSMDEVRRQHDLLVRLADRDNLTMTAGSDNHGWGRTAPNWTLMIIFGWRGLGADALDAQIENVIRQGGFAGARIVERRVASGVGASVALTAIVAPWTMLTTISTDERIAWLIWIWIITAMAWWRRRRRSAIA